MLVIYKIIIGKGILKWKNLQLIAILVANSPHLLFLSGNLSTPITRCISKLIGFQNNVVEWYQ